MENKKDNLENLSLAKMKNLLFDILNKEEYENLIIREPNVIVGEISKGFTNLKTVFFIYQNPLSGNEVDIDTLTKEVIATNNQLNPHQLTIVSGYTVSSSTENKLKANINSNISFINRDHLTELINKHFPHFWMYESFDLFNYEKYFLEEMVEKSALLSIQGLESKAKRLIDIYVKPRIYEIKSDIESKNKQFERVKEIEIINKNKSSIIEGDTGAGKTTLLKEIGRLQIREQKDLKTLPVFISPMSLFNSNFDIEIVASKLLEDKVPGTWHEILNSYKILFLIDNIDEFEEEEQRKIIEQLNHLSQNRNVKFIITTRSIKTSRINQFCKDLNYYQIRKFNTEQIKEFTSRFFQDKGITNNLLEALEDYRILERLPLTPLSLSLIALVYEKEGYEIPATISDIYDNFNQLILGKITANKRFEIIKFNFRERILSIYALEILRNNQGRPYQKQDFIKYFKNYFKNKSSEIAGEVIEEFLQYFIENSGILKIEEETYVNFSHKSFLEYYASIEIFKHNRHLESELVDNFLNLKWQNVSIFYGGQSKDMPNFLTKIIEKVESASKLDEHMHSIMGFGYLLQALYQTDNKLREQAVLLSLEQSLIVHEWHKKISAEGDILLFKQMRLHVMSIFNMYFFYLNFLSSTLSEPLSLAFKKLFDEYKSNPTTSTGYKLLTIAAIFHSKRLRNSSFLQMLFDETTLLKDPYLVTLAEFALYFDSTSYHKDMKQQLHKAYVRFSPVIKDFLKQPASQLRFSKLDLIEPNKKLTIITEGITDALIIEHAYHVLTKDKTPYWKIKPSDEKNGGAKEVKFILDKSKNFSDNDNIIIGIFDQDTEGINQFDGLKYRFYKDYQRVKKMEGVQVYGMKLPVPESRIEYLKQERENFYLSIEHYFDDEILQKLGLIKESGIPGIFKIKDTKSLKVKFAQYVQTLNEPKYFRNFIPLFETIDDITGIQNNDYFEYI
ncbi:MAG: NACHT domain-containing protein [Flavobacteriaceae bacterium]